MPHFCGVSSKKYHRGYSTQPVPGIGTPQGTYQLSRPNQPVPPLNIQRTRQQNNRDRTAPVSQWLFYGHWFFSASADRKHE